MELRTNEKPKQKKKKTCVDRLHTPLGSFEGPSRLWFRSETSPVCANGPNLLCSLVSGPSYLLGSIKPLDISPTHTLWSDGPLFLFGKKSFLSSMHNYFGETMSLTRDK